MGKNGLVLGRIKSKVKLCRGFENIRLYTSYMPFTFQN